MPAFQYMACVGSSAAVGLQGREPPTGALSHVIVLARHDTCAGEQAGPPQIFQFSIVCLLYRVKQYGQYTIEEWCV